MKKPGLDGMEGFDPGTTSSWRFAVCDIAGIWTRLGGTTFLMRGGVVSISKRGGVGGGDMPRVNVVKGVLRLRILIDGKEGEFEGTIGGFMEAIVRWIHGQWIQSRRSITSLLLKGAVYEYIKQPQRNWFIYLQFISESTAIVQYTRKNTVIFCNSYNHQQTKGLQEITASTNLV
jgi:hypothetical protein